MEAHAGAEGQAGLRTADETTELSVKRDVLVERRHADRGELGRGARVPFDSEDCAFDREVAIEVVAPEDSQDREVLAATRYVLLAGLGEPGAERGAERARVRLVAPCRAWRGEHGDGDECGRQH